MDEAGNPFFCISNQMNVIQDFADKHFVDITAINGKNWN